MASFQFNTGDALANKQWSKVLLEEALKDTTVFRFIGGSDAIVQQFDELEKSPGDLIHVGLRMQIVADPKVGDATLRGYEAPLTFYEDNFAINLIRQAVSLTNKDMSQQRVPYELKKEAQKALSDYFRGLFDQTFFNHICGYTPQTLLGWTGNNATVGPDASHHIWQNPGTNAADETITTAGASNVNLMNLTLIDTAVLNAKTATPMIRPVRVGGKDMYVVFVHPQQASDIRTNTNTGQWLDIQKAAMQGGDVTNNPIWTNALGVYHNCIIVEDVRVTNGVNSGTATTAITTVRRAVLCGAQAVALGWGRKKGSRGDKSSVPLYWVEQLDDYENVYGVAANLIYGMSKLVFNSADFADIVMSTYSAL